MVKTIKVVYLGGACYDKGNGKKQKKPIVSKTRKVSVYIIFGIVLAIIVVGIVFAILRSVNLGTSL